MLVSTCTWLGITSLGGVSRLLRRLGISYKRGRDYVHSPDPHYQARQAAIAAAWRAVQADPAHKVLLFLDELTVYRQPSLAKAYAAKGRDQPQARRSLRSDTITRILAVVNAATSQVTYIRRKTTSVHCFQQFRAQIVAAYPGKEIMIVLDNWPLHYHPAVLALLAPQTTPFAFPYSRSWQTLVEESHKQPHTGALPIQLLPLPTYASWLNPIEKLWRKLRQDLLHLHRQANDWLGLRDQVDIFLEQFTTGSAPLLRYSGLLPESFVKNLESPAVRAANGGDAARRGLRSPSAELNWKASSAAGAANYILPGEFGDRSRRYAHGPYSRRRANSASPTLRAG